MPGVIARLCAYAEDLVVAGALALDSEAARRNPHSRIKPVHGTGYLRKQLGEAITPLDVSQFVRQHDSTPLVGPTPGIFGEEHRRAQNTARHRCADARAHEQSHVAVEFQPPGYLSRHRGPRLAGMWRLSNEPPRAHRPHNQASENNKRARKPHP
jgi:hypothetical protein